MKKLRENKSLCLLIFLGIFSFAIGLFYNYRELWMASNGLSTKSISRVITIASIITALTLLFFSIKVSTNKLKKGILISLILKMLTSTTLIILNDTNNLFLIKLVMFFDIAFMQVIFSSIYPLMLSIKKNDEIYTKREVFESVGEKLGFFIVSFFLGKTIGKTVIDYNICLLLSVIFMFISFIFLISIKLDSKESTKNLDVSKAFKYFNQNKSLYLYLFLSFIGGVTFSSIAGLKMLTLTETIGLTAKSASYFVLTCGILTNVLAILIVKYLKFKSDYLNTFMKYGLRVFLYLFIFITGSKEMLFFTLTYLLLTDLTYNFVFSAHFINSIKEDYTLFFTVLKYCVNLIGNGLGTFICGYLFNLSINVIGLAAFVIGLITYITAIILVKYKKAK